MSAPAFVRHLARPLAKLALAAALGTAGAECANAADVLYATGTGYSGALSGLYRIDTVSGAVSQVAPLPGISVYENGLAYDAANDALYAIGRQDSLGTQSRLFRIDRFTAQVVAFPPINPAYNLQGGGLALHPLTGELFASGSNGFQSSGIFRIDKQTGVATLIGQAGGSCCVQPFGFSVGGLGFRSDGTLFANGSTLLSSLPSGAYTKLMTVSTVTGLASVIGFHGVNVGGQLSSSGLAFGSNGVLYSLGSTSASTTGLYQVDPLTGAATVIANLSQQFGANGGLAFAPDGAPQTFCTAKVNSQGCTPAIQAAGSASLSSAAPFHVLATNVLNQRTGLLFYGYAPLAAPFQGGFKCAADPVRRTALQNAGGTPSPTNDCSGGYVFDFNVLVQSGVDPQLVLGQRVVAQYWSRDPMSASTTGLTDAVQFHVLP